VLREEKQLRPFLMAGGPQGRRLVLLLPGGMDKGESWLWVGRRVRQKQWHLWDVLICNRILLWLVCRPRRQIMGTFAFQIGPLFRVGDYAE
jgi:hypothetical protein